MQFSLHHVLRFLMFAWGEISNKIFVPRARGGVGISGVQEKGKAGVFGFFKTSKQKDIVQSSWNILLLRAAAIMRPQEQVQMEYISSFYLDSQPESQFI